MGLLIVYKKRPLLIGRIFIYQSLNKSSTALESGYARSKIATEVYIKSVHKGAILQS